VFYEPARTLLFDPDILSGASAVKIKQFIDSCYNTSRGYETMITSPRVEVSKHILVVHPERE